MKTKAKLQPEQASVLLRLINNPLNIEDEKTRKLIDEAVFDNLVNKRRKKDVLEETGILEDDFNDYLEEVVMVHKSIVEPAFPDKLERGSVSKDVFDAIGLASKIEMDLLEDLQMLFVDGKQIQLMGDTKRAMLHFNDTFKTMNNYRQLLLADENFKDAVNVAKKVNEVDTDLIMYF